MVCLELFFFFVSDCGRENYSERVGRRSVEVMNLRIRPDGDLAIMEGELGQLGVKKGVTARMGARVIV